MDIKVESPKLANSMDFIDIDLRLFGVFDVKSSEAYAGDAPAQASVAPGDASADSASEAQEETSDAPESAGADEIETASNEGQTTEQGAQETEEAQASVAPSKDDWVIPGKVRTLEDLKWSWLQAQQQLGRLHRETAELKRELADLRKSGASQEQIDQKQQQINDAQKRAELQKELLREMVKDPLAFMERVKRETISEVERTFKQQQAQVDSRLSMANRAIELVAEKYPDFAQFQQAVTEEVTNNRALRLALDTLAKNPDATEEDYAEIVKTAYLSVKSQQAAAVVSAARQQGRQEATAQVAAKRQAAAAPQATRRDQTQESVEDRIRREIVEAGRRRGLWGRR